MKKLTIVFAILFCTYSYAQEDLFFYDYRHVPNDEMEAFQKNEAEFWAKVHQNMKGKKQITGWAMCSRVGGVAKDPNIYFYLGIGSFENLDNIDKNYRAAYNEVMSSMDADAQEEMKERLKIDSHRIANVLLNRHSAVLVENSKWNYIVHNYAKANNVGAFLDVQDKYFKPFFEEHIKAGNTKQKVWITASVLNPVGDRYNWNCYTADTYENMSDIYNSWNSEVTWPEGGMAEVAKTMETPNFYKSVIWKKIMWLDADGKFHSIWD